MELPHQSPIPLSVPNYLRQDFLTPRCENLLPTLPSQRGWVTSHCYLYKGFWFETAYLNAILSCQNHFQARNNDIILASFPKSGTTWLKAVVFALTHRFRKAPDSLEQDHPLLVKSPHDLIPFLEIDLYYDNESPDLSSFATNPSIFATHIPYSLLPQSMKDSECKIIYMCRNPKDTLISYWHFTNKLRPSDDGENALEEVFDKFSRGVCPFGPFWDHVLEYWRASLDMPERVFFLKYEEMMERPSEVIRRLADFIGSPFPKEEEDAMNDIATMCSFENMSRLAANKSGNVPSGAESWFFFRKGKVGDWTNFLSPEMSEKLDRVMDEKLRGSGLKF